MKQKIVAKQTIRKTISLLKDIAETDKKISVAVKHSNLIQELGRVDSILSVLKEVN